MSNPKPGWTIEDAIRLLDEGYSPEQVERTTGFAAAHAEAAHRAASKQPVRAQAVPVPPVVAAPPRRASSPSTKDDSDGLAPFFF